MTAPDLATIAVCAAAIALAGVVRGFSGFGFGLVAVPAFSFVLHPAGAIALAMILQVFSGGIMLRDAWQHVDARLVTALSAGTLLPLGLGFMVLESSSVDQIRIYMAVVMFGAVVALSAGWRLKHPVGPRLGFATGAICGLLNGTTGMGGPPAIMVLLGSPMSSDAARANLAAYFTVLGITTIIGLAWLAHIDEAILVLAAIELPALIGATILGGRLYALGGQDRYRKLALAVLAALAAVTILRVLGFFPAVA
jgi:hypothetical protein